MLSLINVFYHLNNVHKTIKFEDIILITFLNVPIIVLNLNQVYFFSELLFLIIVIFYLRLKLRIRLKKLFIEYFIILLVDMIFELLIFTFLNCKMGQPINDNYILLTKIIITFLTYFIMVTVNKKRLLKYIERYILDTSNFMAVVLLALVTTIGITNYYTYNQKLIHIIFFLFAVITVILIGIIRYYQHANRINMIKLNNMIRKEEESKIYLNSFKLFKHNLKYKLIGLKNLTEVENNNIIDDLINSNELEIKKVDIINNIPASLINIMMDPIVNKIDFINLKITNHLINNDLNYKSNKEYLTMCELIGNAVTNAIESSTDNSVLLFNFYEDNDFQSVEIINNFENNIDVSLIGSINYSTKKRNSGYGLNYLLSSNVETEIKILNNLFVVKIKLSK